MRVIALVGLSGVGKSTFAKKVAREIPLRHMQASDLIKSELARTFATGRSSEELRVGPVLDNQALMIAAFMRAIRDDPRLVLFDGHTVIDSPAGLIEISADVFAALRVNHIVFLRADPGRIMLQRGEDGGRSRPSRSAAELALQQDVALAVAQQIARTVAIPITIIGQADVDRVCGILRAGEPWDRC